MYVPSAVVNRARFAYVVPGIVYVFNVLLKLNITHHKTKHVSNIKYRELSCANR